MDGLIKLQDAINEVKRFAGYLDDDMIYRIVLALERLPETPPRCMGFYVGQYIIYRNGERYELGRIKEFAKDGAFVSYTEGTGGSLTLFSDMHPLINDYCIEKTTLGGGYFELEVHTGQTDHFDQ